MNLSIKKVIRKDLQRKDGQARIDFVVYMDGKQYRISSGKSVEVNHWNSKSECVEKKFKHASEINKYLSEKEEAYNNYLNLQHAIKQDVLIEEVQSILKGISVGESRIDGKKKLPYIKDMFDEYIKLNDLKKGTIHNYETTKNVLIDFTSKHYKKTEATIDIVDFRFLETLKKYLIKERVKSNNPNTVAKRLKMVKTVLLYSINLGHEIKNPFDGYKIKNGKSKEVTLDREEYERIYHLKLPSESRATLKLTRDIFVFSCETALRYSDVMDLQKIHIDNDMVNLFKDQVKTTTPVFVPLSKRAKSLIIKYKNKDKKRKGNSDLEFVFPKICNQTVNNNLKVLAKMCSIDKNVTSHVARHTFASLAGASGCISSFGLSKIMGHSSSSMTDKYVNPSNNDAMNAMNRIWNNQNVIKTSN